MPVAGEQLASDIGAPLVARIPIEPDVSAGGDAGSPVALRDRTDPAGAAFHALAARMVEDLLPPIEMAGCTARMLELMEQTAPALSAQAAFQTAFAVVPTTLPSAFSFSRCA